MKIAANIAGALLGLLFVLSGFVYFFQLIPTPEFPEGSPIALMMGAFGPTGYFDFVKALEIIGGVLIAIPATRNLGLLVLGPILVNILAFHTFITKGAGLFDPPLVFITAAMAFLLWTRRKAFVALVTAR